jgi:gliding motility associated protien GldN
MKTLLKLLILGCMFNVNAQIQTRGPLPINTETSVVDGPYIPDEVVTKKLVQQENSRQVDVVYSKRLWRTIDLRERQNRTLYYPHEDFRYVSDEKDLNAPLTVEFQQSNRRWSLWSVIRHGVLNEKVLIPYFNSDPLNINADIFDGDQFKYPCLLGSAGVDNDEEYKSRLQKLFYYVTSNGKKAYQVADSQGVQYDSLDANNNVVTYDDISITPILSQDIIEYRLKEDWYFDKEASSLKVRIIGIAPVIYNKDQEGNITGKKVLFWIYFDHARHLFNNYMVYKNLNDARWMSFDDLFIKREFGSYVYKESNSFDRSIEHYRRGVDALLESEVIKNNIFTLENDLWEF